ncbi:hypothetical protein M0802_006424 [Mischocyttarus mexicanus]|nr:hypothetical protein M0802_006424 [Mischocyttarus mexicanus]
MAVVNSNNYQNGNKYEKVGSTHVFERKFVLYDDLSHTLIQENSDYSKQYSNVYVARLAELGKVLSANVNAKWKDVKIVKLADLNGIAGSTCAIIGTLYKHQIWKPSILRKVSDRSRLLLQPRRHHYCSTDDQIFLEDEELRIKLVGDLVNHEDLVTGLICAVLGNEGKDGTFTVKDWCFPGCAPQTHPTLNFNSSGKIVLISGLNFVKNSNDEAVELLHEWITGMAGNTTAQEEEASIVRLIIAGNSVSNSKKKYERINMASLKVQKDKHSTETIHATKKLDTFLSNIAKCCGVTLIPGQYDSCNKMLPQKPFHPCLLPNSCRLTSFQSSSNPWIGLIGKRMVMGSSGESIEDIMKASGSKDTTPLQWLEKTLIWRHMCPTGPDTLPTYPYNKKDFFIINQCPDIYFTGNADKFETKLFKGEQNQVVRLVCIPQFSTSHAAVIVDLETLDTELIHFGID